MKKWIFFTISIAIVAGIFWFSSKDAGTSTQQSDTIIIKMKLMTEQEIKENPEKARNIRFLVRKSSHFCLYMLLGLFLFLSVLSFTDAYGFSFLFAWFLTLLLAGLDEFHQSFVPGRSMEVRDVLIDAAGAFLSIALAYLLFKAKEKSRSNRKVYYFGKS